MREVPAKQGVTSLYRLNPPPLYALQKMGIQGDESPWRSSRQRLEVFPFAHIPPYKGEYMEIQVTPAVRGSVRVPPSKSMAHRAIICACLAEGKSRIGPLQPSQDIQATLRCMSALGASLRDGDSGWMEVKGAPSLSEAGNTPLLLDCGESGSTLRFLIPLALLTGREISFTGHGRLLERPQSVYEELFREQQVEFLRSPKEIRLRGRLRPGAFTVRGDVSSQFITGLLFALPLLEEDSEIHILPPFESRSYVELTLETLGAFGIRAGFQDASTLRVPGRQHYRPGEFQVEGDYSQAAFFAVLGALSGQMDCLGLRRETRQGDAVVLEHLRRFGAKVVPLEEGWRISQGSGLSAHPIDLADCPDLGPILMVLAAYAKGTTVFSHTGRLRLKESDRGAAMAQELKKLGVSVQTGTDTITVRGERLFPIPEGVLLNAHNDHRIAMSLAVFAACGQASVTIQGAESVAKSYPRFWQDLRAAGVRLKGMESARPGFGPGPELLIVGLGLIGGSYARALTKRGLRVTAIDVNPAAVEYALTQGIIADGTADPAREEELIRRADILVLSLYPTQMAEWVLSRQSWFRPGLRITDVSGVKRAVVYRLQEGLRPDVEFIASHPMAGRELSGVENSDDRIFSGANFIVTPTERNTPEAVRWAEDLGRLLGFGRISVLSPEEHDQMIGYLSQLTHAIAVSLMNANDSPHLVEYTGDSFRDLTRIARINGPLWSELFALNKDILIPEIDSFIAALEDLKEKLGAGEMDALQQLFAQSTARRKLFDR